MQLFFSQNIEGKSIFLNEEESRHVKVLRKNVGDHLSITDGKGNLFLAEILLLSKKCELNIVSSTTFPIDKRRIHIIVAPTKNMDRLEWMVEKCCEIGVQEFSFIKCQRSERKVLKLSRLEKKALSAMKQSKQFYLPKLNELKSFKEVIQNVDQTELNFIAHCEDSTQKKAFQNIPDQANFNIIIGPEGDFTNDELELAKSYGFLELKLGDSILRTETAAMVAVSLLRNL